MADEVTDRVIVDDHRTESLVVLLSLDLVSPFYEEMGLALPQGADAPFREALRSLVVENGGASIVELPRGYGERARERIGAEVGPEAQRSLTEWATYIHSNYPSEHRHTNAWMTILRVCASTPQDWARLELPADRSDRLRRDFRLGTSTKDIEALIEEMLAEPRSEWDASVIVQRSRDIDEWEPMDSVELDIDFFRFKGALQKLVDDLSPEELADFESRVRQVGVEDELTMVPDLKGSGELWEAA